MAHLQQNATLADLASIAGKAELVGGRIVEIMPTGRKPNRIAGRIYRSLDDYAASVGRGEAFTDNMGYAVPVLSSGRESFSPDASYHVGPFPANPMKFIAAAPTFAVEVRSENDYAPIAEAEIADKRADYFEAGTRVVWDVDTKNGTIRAYHRDRPEEPEEFRSGEEANAEVAAPGWAVRVDWVFA